MTESDERKKRMAMLTALLFILSAVSYTMYQNDSDGDDNGNETVSNWIDPVYPAGPAGDANHSHGGSDEALLAHWLWTENMTLIDYHNLNCDGERSASGGDRNGRPCSPEFKNAEAPSSTPGDAGEIAIEGDFPECILGCYAYVAAYNAMHIIDISDLSNIQMTGTYYSSVARIIDVKVSKDQQWALINHEVTNIDDDGNPLDPVPSNINPGANAIDLIDISDKTNPVFSWRWQNPPAGYHNQEVYQYDNGDYFGFLADPYVEGANEAVKGTEIHKIDYASSGTLTLWGEYTPDLSTTCGGSVFNHDNVVRKHPVTGQDLFYGAYWDAGLRIVDVSNPPSLPPGGYDPNTGNVIPVWNPPEIGRWLGCSTDGSGWYGPDGGGHGGMSVDTWLDAGQGNGNEHYVIPFDELVNGRHYTAVAPEFGSNANHTGWIFLVDTTDPTKPFMVSKWRLPGNHIIEGGYMYSPHNGDTGNGHIYFAHYHAGAWITDATTVASTIKWKEDANMDYYDFDASDGDDTVYCENGASDDCFNGFYEIEEMGTMETLAYYLPHGPDWIENPYEKLDYAGASSWTGSMIPFDWGLQYDPRGYVLIAETTTGIYVVQYDGDINPEACTSVGVNCMFEPKNGNYDS